MIVSICVPVYNVEKYIERCAFSLFGQTYDDIEYIFVNDGSKDLSIQKLNETIEKFPKRKGQIKVLQHACNRGLSAARNTAVDNCKGVFLLHVDSDDYLEEDAIEKLVEKQLETGADIVTGQAVSMNKESLFVLERSQFVNHDDFVEDMIKPSIHHTIWGRLIRRSLYTENNIEAKEGVNIGEDLQVMSQLAYYAKRTESVWDVIYHYDCTNEFSYMNQFDTKDVKRLVQDTKSMEVVRDFFVGKSDRFHDLAEKYLCDYYLKLLRVYANSCSRDDFEKTRYSLLSLRPQNRKMTKRQELKFSSYRTFKLVDVLLK